MSSPIARRYGVDYCTICDLALTYCRCVVTMAANDQDGTARLRGGCAHCGRTMAECRCGTTPAGYTSP